MNESGFIIVDYPLKGEWTTPHTPGDRIPSHGTDGLGQRFAYDFLRIEHSLKKKFKFYKSSSTKYHTIGLPIRDCFCYKEDIFSPVNGTVVAVRDGLKEPQHIHPVLDFLKVIIRSIFLNIQAIFISASKFNLHKLVGNYIIIKFDNYYAFFAHLSPGTITVDK